MTEDTTYAGPERHAASQLPSLSATEQALILATIRDEVRAGVEEAMESYRRTNCLDHQARTLRMERLMLGNGQAGLDERVRELDRWVGRINRLTWIAVSGVVLAVIGIIATLVQVAILGR